MARLDYEELYILLYNMKRSKTISELSGKIYCSISKVSKMITYYEKKLKIQLYIKSSEYLLSDEGYQILDQIQGPLKQMQKIVHRENKVIGIDENLIEDKINLENGYKYKYMNCKDLIEDYKSGILDKIIVSSDYESEIKFNSKSLVKQKDIYFIRKKGSASKVISANAIGCPITKKLENKNIKIDNYLTQSVAICKMVRQNEGGGYTFNFDTLNKDLIDIKLIKDLQINFFVYNKY